MRKTTLFGCLVALFTFTMNAQVADSATAPSDTDMMNVEMGTTIEKQLLIVAPENLTAENKAEILANSLRTNLTSTSGNTRISRKGVLADIIPTAGATETFSPSVGDHFFDPGGPGGGPTGGTPGNYPNCDCDTQTTLAGVSEIDFLFFSVFGNFDYVRIYDGTDATGTLLYDNGVGGPNDGDITLVDMIASNGSSAFTATSGNFFFFFHASSVVDYGGWDVEIVSGGGGGGCADAVIEVNQNVNDTCMANISQGGLAQSYIPTEPDAAGAGIMFIDPSSGLDVNLSLWDGLPNAGGTMLASGTSQTDGTVWADVFWDPVVNVTVGTTYYIVIDGDITLPCVAGSTNNPYPDGNVFANPSYDPFPTFDYTFRTYSCATVGIGENDLGSFSYYPNPTNGVLNLKSAENIENIKMYNVLGQMVINTNVNATTSQVDISALNPGTYLMKVVVNGEIGTYRVLKQ